ncbi:MAG: hypothetical protein KTR16_05235 [Acidiferrobacterales bacterium]|nr:hypothetical protein [Acidiferrobacterales bacterium]
MINTESGDAAIKVKNGRLSIKSNDPDNVAYINTMTVSETIFDTNSQTLFVIDHDAKTVSPITQANIEQLGNTISAATEVLDSMPTEQRETLSGFMKGLGLDVPEANTAPELKLDPLSQQQFRGIRCQENAVIEDKQELGRVCITQANSTPLSNEDYETLLNAQAFFLNIARQAQPFADQYGQSIPNLNGLELSGLVVYSNQTQVDPETPPASFVVTGVDTNNIDEIAIPTTYQSRPILSSN